MSKSVQIGSKFGRLTVLRFESRDGYRFAVCKCSCGNETSVTPGNLRGTPRGKNGFRSVKSCGCLSRELFQARRTEKLGKRYGRLLVTAVSPTRIESHIRWECRCDCGKEVTVTGSDLSSGHTQSCGCLNKDRVREARRKPKGESGFTGLLLSMKRGAKVRGYEWKLTRDEVKEITKQNCFYCGREPSQVTTNCAPNASPDTRTHSEYIYNGIDRVNNELGYNLENVVPCCKFCNRSKRTMTQEEFRECIIRLTQHLDKWQVLEENE